MLKETRIFARIQLEMQASLHLFQAEVIQSGSVLNLSQGGCFFLVENPPPIGEQCHIKLTVGEGLKTKTIDLPGIIARTDDNGVGIQFIDISEENHINLEKILSPTM